MGVTPEQCKANGDICRNNIKQIMEKFEKKLDKIYTIVNEQQDKFEKRFDKRYANKQTEIDVGVIKSDLRKIVFIILGGVILAVLGLILK